jgi:hypothetical protein
LSQEIKQKRALRIEWEEEDAKLAAEKTEPLGPISWTIETLFANKGREDEEKY